MISARGLIVAAALSAAFLLALSLLVVGDAWGHSWYEGVCCSGKDCAPIPDDEVTEMNGGYFLKTRNEFVAFKDTRQGRDDQYHLCVNEVTNARLCFYRKFNGS